MRRVTQAIFTAVLFVVPLMAAIDGVWVGDVPLDLNQHSASKKKEAPKMVPMKVTFASKGNTLTGMMTIYKGNKPDVWTLRKGRVVGNAISFEVYRQTKTGMEEMRWDGVLQGETLKLTRGLKALGRQVLLHRPTQNSSPSAR